MPLTQVHLESALLDPRDEQEDIVSRNSARGPEEGRIHIVYAQVNFCINRSTDVSSMSDVGREIMHLIERRTEDGVIAPPSPQNHQHQCYVVSMSFNLQVQGWISDEHSRDMVYGVAYMYADRMARIGGSVRYPYEDFGYSLAFWPEYQRQMSNLGLRH